MNVVVIGHGGHSKVISDVIHASEGNKVIGYLDSKYEEVVMINNLFLGPISSVIHIKEKNKDVKFLMAIGNNKTRKAIVEMLDLTMDDYITITHPSASISSSAKIGRGTVVMPNTVINADAVIGDHCIINTGSIVEHDCLLEDYVHLCPNSTITGTVTLGEGVFLGSSSTIIPNKRIGAWTTIGAGATVIDDLPEFCVAVGTPAKVKVENIVNTG